MKSTRIEKSVIQSFDSRYNELNQELNSPSYQNIKKQNSEGLNIIRDTIALCLKVSEISNTPILFLSNPGEGKTTGVDVYGRVTKRHVEALMGSQFSQDDILGFMVNTGKEYLETKIPEWYHRIMEYTKWHWEIKDDLNFELGETERKKLIDRKKLFIRYQNDDISDMELLDIDIPFDQIDIQAAIYEIDKELNDKFIWSPPRKTILFLDELSAVHPTVQASLLRLCHSRVLRGNNKLPDDCIVCAAGNYKGNLPSAFNIIAPELNRFCIINLLRGASTDNKATLSKELVKEFTQGYKEVCTDFPSFDRFKFSPDMDERFLEACREKLIMICDEFADEDGANGTLDVRNTEFNDIFEGSDVTSEVSNFISGRVISKYVNVLKALCELRIEPEYLRGVYKKFAIGLLGLGTNSWDDDIKDRELQISSYQNTLCNATRDILKEFNHPDKQAVIISDDSKFTLETYDKNSIYGKVHGLVNTKQSDFEKNLDAVLEQISQEFPSMSAKVIPNLISTLQDADISTVIAWRADYEAISLLSTMINSNLSKAQASIYSSAIKRVLDIYEFYYRCLIVNDVNLEDITNA